MRTLPHRLLISLALGVAVTIMTSASADAAACPAKPFRTSPIRLAGFTHIIPLGNLNPPDHTIPTDHIYFSLPEDGDGNTFVRNVYAPSRITITAISVSTYFQDTTRLARDYTIEFTVCDELSGRLGHMSTIVPSLQKLVTKWDECHTYEANAVGNQVKYCTRQVNATIKNNTKIGSVGGLISHALDLWTYDTRVDHRAKVANPARYLGDAYFRTTCPITYYRTDVRTALMAKLGADGMPRTKAPRCGSFTVDRVGTLGGNWFHGDARDDPEGWEHELAFVYSNLDGTSPVISIGGVIADAGTVSFTPASSGRHNRPFEEVTPNGAIYCYDSDWFGTPSEHFLVKLLSATKLKIERQDGACDAPYVFTDPTVYRR